MRRLPGPARDRPGDGGNSRGSLRVVSGLAENTNSIFCDGSSQARGSKWMSGSAPMQEPSAERLTRAAIDRDQTHNALSKARQENSRFSLDIRLTWKAVTRQLEHLRLVILQALMGQMGCRLARASRRLVACEILSLRRRYARHPRFRHPLTNETKRARCHLPQACRS